MEKITEKSLPWFEVNGFRANLDDVEYLVELIKTANFQVIIKDDDFKYDSLQELIDKRGMNPKVVEIIGRAEDIMTDVSVTFKKSELRLSAYNAPELYYRIKEHFEKKKTFSYRIFSPWTWWFVLNGFYWVFLAAYNSIKVQSQGLLLIMWLVFMALILFWLGSLIHRKFDLGLKLVREHQGGFLKRNRDDIVLLFIGSSFGAVITVIIQKLIEKL